MTWIQPQRSCGLVNAWVLRPLLGAQFPTQDRLGLLGGVRGPGLVRGVRVADLLAAVRPTQVLQAVVRGVVIDVVDRILVVPPGQIERHGHGAMEFVHLTVDHDSHVAAGFGFGGRNHPFAVAVATEVGDPGGLVGFEDFSRHLVRLRPLELVLARPLALPTATRRNETWIQPQRSCGLLGAWVLRPLLGAQRPTQDRLGLLGGVRRPGLIRGVRVADLLSAARPAQVVEAVVRGVVIDVVDRILVVPPGQIERHGHDAMHLAELAVDVNTHVTAGLGFGGRDDSVAVPVATEIGNLGFGGSFGRFDHCCFGGN